MPQGPQGAPTFQGDNPNAKFGNAFSKILGGDNGDGFGFQKNGTFGPNMGQTNGGMSFLGGILKALNLNPNFPSTNPISGRPIDHNWMPPPNNGSQMPPPANVPTADPNAQPNPTVPNANTPTTNTGGGGLFNMGDTDSSPWQSRNWPRIRMANANYGQGIFGQMA